jgi:molybdopterin synthase sulfur carrier subunit
VFLLAAAKERAGGNVEMAVTVRIASPLQPLTDGQPNVDATGATVREVLADLEGRFEALRERLRDDEGRLRRHINLYVNDDDARALQGEHTPVGEGDEVSIIPAIAGG